ncbi:MAG TPA: hypothetical protein VLX61_17705 [Anaerolineales bacterium]|nr:hypothetical protein [Anaerolineales bacterium]
MTKKMSLLLMLSIFIAACNLPSATMINSRATPSITATETSSVPLPPVAGPDPSYKVAAFYYPWYGNPKFDGQWIHWEETHFNPPQDISSDYYPEMGAYSSHDPAVVAQHMAWLREAGIGVIIVSWWGPGTYEDSGLPLILQTADHYGIKVAFHIEPYDGRTADSLISDIKYIYQRYGSSPAFFRSTSTTHYSPGRQPKGMFFVWCIESIGTCGAQSAQADYWQKAMDEIHALPDSALVIANTLQGSWIDGGHFDGLYNYATLHLEQEGGFNWTRSLPPDSLYIPSVIPGFSAKRVGDPADTFVPRDDGATFNDQWAAALGTGIQPDMVTITSFNEWHEGTMIEPPALGANDGKGYSYADFGKLPPDGYLTLSHQWIQKYLNTTWPTPTTYRVRIQIDTTSDWTTLAIVSGGGWMRPHMVEASPTATQAGIDDQGRLALLQSLDDANGGKQVEMSWDLLLTSLDPSGNLILEIDRGDLGSTQVTIYNYAGNSPVQVKTFNWHGITSGRNPDHVVVPDSLLISASNP